MSGNWTGGVYHLTTLCPLLPGRASELRTILAQLPTGEASPLAQVPGTHFGRWVVIDRFGAHYGKERPVVLDPPRLQFSANFDGEPEVYLGTLFARIGEIAAQLWGNCVGFPGTGDAGAFADWLRSYEIDAALPFATIIDITVPGVSAALDTRARLSAFAVRHQFSDPTTLRRAWAEEFG